MSFQKPTQYDDPPKLQHSKMAKDGRPLLVQVANVRWVKNNTLFLAELIFNNVKHVYFTSNRDIAQGFIDHVGQQVCLIATGNDKMGTAKMELQPAGKPASQLPSAPRAEEPKKAPPVREVAPEPRKEQPDPVDRKAKVFLCQAANLMRLCVKKANDIAIELDLPDAHRQGIATTLFIQADRQGYISGMPISAYSTEELGWGASKAESLKTPQPEEVDD